MYRVRAGILTLIVATAAAVADDSALSDLLDHFSTGWFPRTYPTATLMYSSVINFYQHSSATNISTSGTHPIAGSWSARSPFRDNEDEIKQPWSSKEANGSFPVDGYIKPIALRLQTNIPLLPVLARVDIAYEMSRERLYWLDTSRQYLSLNGVPASFREVSVLFNNEHFLAARLGITLPVYGAFVATAIPLDSMRSFALDRICSYYYVGGYIHAAALVMSEATQYVQIADAKSQLRYANGQDTVTLMNKEPLSTATPLRTSVGVVGGWQFGFGSFAVSIEVYAEFPLTSVLTDAQWMLYRYGIRTALGFEL